MVPLRIKISSPARATDLLAFLRGLGADAKRESERTIVIMRRHAVVPGEPPYQDRLELEFVLRAWARDYPDARFEVEEPAVSSSS
jgi:hypothetical protein